MAIFKNDPSGSFFCRSDRQSPWPNPAPIGMGEGEELHGLSPIRF